MTVNRGIEQGELGDVLERKDFQDELFKVAWYSLRTFKEAAVAVYKDESSGDISVSSALYADSEFDTRQLYLDYSTVSQAAYQSICDIDLHFTDFEQRSDVALSIHSHIPLPREDTDPYNYLRPSIPDLENHEALAGEIPGTIGGIAVPHRSKNELSLMLYRASDTKEQQPWHYQILESDYGKDGKDRVLQAMGQAGLNAVVIKWDLFRPRNIRTDLDKAASELFA